MNLSITLFRHKLIFVNPIKNRFPLAPRRSGSVFMDIGNLDEQLEFNRTGQWWQIKTAFCSKKKAVGNPILRN